MASDDDDKNKKEPNDCSVELCIGMFPRVCTDGERSSVGRALEFKSKDPVFDPLAGQGEEVFPSLGQLL